MTKQTAKDAITAAAARLYWERGYEATSPNAVLAASGAGKGSLYHHFTGKADLAAEVLDAVADEMIGQARAILSGPGAPLDRLRAYLLMERQGLAGCRMGRLAGERAVITNDVLRAPLARYFEALVRLLEATIAVARDTGALPRSINSRDLARTLAAVVQGGFTLSRATGDAGAARQACQGAWAMVAAIAVADDQSRAAASAR